MKHRFKNCKIIEACYRWKYFCSNMIQIDYKSCLYIIYYNIYDNTLTVMCTLERWLQEMVLYVQRSKLCLTGFFFENLIASWEIPSQQSKSRESCLMNMICRWWLMVVRHGHSPPLTVVQRKMERILLGITLHNRKYDTLIQQQTGVIVIIKTKKGKQMGWPRLSCGRLLEIENN